MSSETRQHTIADGLLSVLAFVMAGMFCRFALYYLREGIALFSMINAGIWTMLSAAIIIPLYRNFGMKMGVMVGVVLYCVVFFFSLSYVFVNPTLTLKTDGHFIFQEGHITSHGLTSYLVLSGYESIVSMLSLLALVKLDLATTR